MHPNVTHLVRRLAGVLGHVPLELAGRRKRCIVTPRTRILLTSSHIFHALHLRDAVFDFVFQGLDLIFGSGLSDCSRVTRRPWQRRLVCTVRLARSLRWRLRHGNGAGEEATLGADFLGYFVTRCPLAERKQNRLARRQSLQ